MIAKREEEKAVSLSCNGGYEGTPGDKKKGQSCLMSIKGTIRIKYKKPVAIEEKKED